MLSFLNLLSSKLFNIKSLVLFFISYYFFRLSNFSLLAQNKNADDLNFTNSIGQFAQQQQQLSPRTSLDTSQIIWMLIILLLALLIFLVICVLRITQLKDNSNNITTRSEAFINTFPFLIQGTTIFLVVIAAVILAFMDPSSSQGVISLLSAIAGYVLGKGNDNKTNK